MSLKDALLEERAKSLPRSKCKVCDAIAELPTDELAFLQAALADGAWGNEAIARALTREGFAMGPHPVARHRKGGCQR